MEEKSKSSKLKLIEEVKDIGQSIIDNAKSIVGDEKYLVIIKLECEIGDPSKAATIKVTREFIPEGIIE